MTDPASIAIALLVLALAAMLSAGLILASWSWLKTYAIARPNARSSHREPTPQGGGAAVILSTFVFALGAAAVNSSLLSTSDIHQLLALTAAVALLAVLGDVGSLPIGLVVAWLLLQLAARGELAAALILPLYYVADATVTLLGRVVAREPVWQAHRSHFYQRAVDGGFSVSEIVAHVFALNLALVALALLAAVSGSRLI